jgi:hypothetical protein
VSRLDQFAQIGLAAAGQNDGAYRIAQPHERGEIGARKSNGVGGAERALEAQHRFCASETVDAQILLEPAPERYRPEVTMLEMQLMGELA